MPDYEKIIVELLGFIISVEGTDFLNRKGESEALNFPTLSDEDAEALTRLRDEARKSVGWQGY